MDSIPCIALGILATALLDAWTLMRRRLLGTPLPNYRLVGRWLAHMQRGRFRHDAIASATPKRGEQAIGWIAHYLTGIAFATLLLALAGMDWLRHPTLAGAMGIGFVSVLAPFLLMQPGMGMGIAAARTPHPNRARLQSLSMHAAFGFCLYFAGRILGLPSLL
ncbi:DUF2938 domain-containing protein [Arenimonas sp.]|uniref:DUF2938 domain-containing protein n=1 Tax=Arenimonas sp. TaxID=1872635 RepID=UPI0039E22C43